MTELNEPQRMAVAHTEGPLLVFAGAGSGKTRTITYRIANLLATHHVPPYRILAVTFTNKAAGEMRERLEGLAGAEVTRDLWVGTFHAICARLLRRYHDAVGLSRYFVIYDDADQKAIVGRILKELGFDDRSYPPKQVLSKIHAQKREGRGPDKAEGWDFEPELFQIYERYQAALRTADAVDFDDLILHVMRIAEDADSPAGKDLRSRFSYVLVDEFQDTNMIQYRLIRALSAQTRNLCVVGDDDQSIYRWRGANVELIRGFRKDFADATIIKLEQNYRSSANIVKAALGVIKPAFEREPKELWTSAPAGEKVVLRAVRDERDESAWVVRGVRAQLERGISADEMAIFYRVHAQSRVLEEGLRAENIPYQIVGGMRFFERAEVKDLLAYLRLIENPNSEADLLRVINVPARGIGNKTVERLLDTATECSTSAYAAIEHAIASSVVGTQGSKKLAQFRNLIESLRAEREKFAPHALAERVLEVTGYRAMLNADDSAESDARLENLEEVIGSIKEYELQAEASGEAPTMSGYLERVSLVAAVDSLRDIPAVSLMTVHSAKGLEFQCVWLTGMEEETFPYRGLRSHEIEELDEERRLAYVAITRARTRLFITYAASRTLFGQTRYLEPSRFLEDLPEDVIDHHAQVSYASASRPSWGPPEPSYAAPRYGSRLPPKRAPGERFVDQREAFDEMPGDEPGVSVRPGDRVKHKRFGLGIVESVESPNIVARFRDHGRKRILAEYLEFE